MRGGNSRFRTRGLQLYNNTFKFHVFRLSILMLSCKITLYSSNYSITRTSSRLILLHGSMFNLLLFLDCCLVVTPLTSFTCSRSRPPDYLLLQDHKFFCLGKHQTYILELCSYLACKNHTY